MKAKVQIWVNVGDMTIHSIVFHDRILESTISNSGKIKFQKFLRKLIIQMPLQMFKPYFKSDMPYRSFMMINQEIDVYPHITLHKKAPYKLPHPYNCDLHPAPVLGMQATTFEEYYKHQAAWLSTFPERGSTVS